MSLSGVFQWFAEQAKYAIAFGVAMMVMRGLGKSKIMSIVVGLIVGGLSWYFIDHYETVLTALGNLIGKIFG